MGAFNKFVKGLKKTRENFTHKFEDLFLKGKIDDEFFEELEEILISGDVGVDFSLNIVAELKEVIKSDKITDRLEIKNTLKKLMVNKIEGDKTIAFSSTPTVILVLGVNGVGKTTTIGKLAYRFKKDGNKVIIGAGDTFRAAAIDQLAVWADKVGVDIISHQTGADPGSVIFDTITAAKSRKTDVVLCDTAGRLHTKSNLMEELKKIARVAEKACPGSPHETLLVIDAMTGQNAIPQAELFNQAINITGLIITKLDGTARGGIAIAVKDKLKIPIKYVGIGEGLEDLHIFDAKEYVDAILSV